MHATERRENACKVAAKKSFKFEFNANCSWQFFASVSRESALFRRSTLTRTAKPESKPVWIATMREEATFQCCKSQARFDALQILRAILCLSHFCCYYYLYVNKINKMKLNKEAANLRLDKGAKSCGDKKCQLLRFSLQFACGFCELAAT